MVRGRRIHDEIEHYIQGAEQFPSSGKKIKDTLDYCREAYTEGKATTEEKWGFRIDWTACEWMSDDVWLRMATDCMIKPDKTQAIIYDWKTGKSFGNEVKYMQQMQLYAIGAFARFPDLECIDVHLAFVDDGKIRTKDFIRNDKLYKLMGRFHERGERMTSATEFRPKANMMNCKFCPFGPVTGTGSCVYGVGPL